MCCFTYLNDTEGKTVDEPELNQILQEVREATGKDWRIKEYRPYVRGWFKKRVVARYFGLYVESKAPEFQIINFYRPESTNSIITDASLVAAFLYGVLAGVNNEKF
jgi:predicted lipase